MADEHPDDKRLMDLLRLHTEEVRFQVNLTWDRAKSSLAFHAAWIAIAANMTQRGTHRFVLVGMFGFAAISAMFGASMVEMGHDNYRAARDRRREVEALMSTKLGIVSTPSSRGDAGPKWRRIYVALMCLHALLGSLALISAIWAWRGM